MIIKTQYLMGIEEGWKYIDKRGKEINILKNLMSGKKGLNDSGIYHNFQSQGQKKFGKRN